jgi:predicted amidophosphoribosyltransferase
MSVRCVICQRPAKRSRLCKLCGRSYDRHAHRDGSVLEAMAWAAARARRFERLRAKQVRP